MAIKHPKHAEVAPICYADVCNVSIFHRSSPSLRPVSKIPADLQMEDRWGSSIWEIEGTPILSLNVWLSMKPLHETTNPKSSLVESSA